MTNLSKDNVFVDNEMQDAFKNIGLIFRLTKSGLKKRSVDSVPHLLYCLLIWPLIESYIVGEIGLSMVS